MKNGKKPTLAQKKFLQGKGLVPENWLIVKDTPVELGGSQPGRAP